MRVGREQDLRRTSRRLGLQTALALVALLVLVGVLVLSLYERSEHRAAARQLERTALSVTTPRQAPLGISVVIERGGRRVASANLPDGLPLEADLTRVAADGAARQREVELDGRTFVVRTVAVGDRLVQVAQDRTAAEEASGRVVGALVLGGVGGVLLVGVVSTYLARRAVAPLERSLAMQRRFVTDASHELRTPLTLLSTRVQLLARRLRDPATVGGPGTADPAVLRDVEGVVADTRRLTGILDDLLAAADDGREATRTPTAIGEVVRAAVASATAAAGERGVRLGVRTEGSADAARVQGSPVALGRAVTALVDNAVDHAHTDVTVTVGRDRGELRVTVADDGPGIPDGEADHLFERFASTRSGPAGGRRHYGLGLALVADVAASHGGRVEVDPEHAPGAAITLVLPALPG